jgi:hypothetical protein
MFPSTGNEIAKICPVCWTEFLATGSNAGKHTYCSTRCRHTAFDRRRTDRPGRGSRPIQPTSLTAGSPASTQRPQPAAERACPHCGGLVTIVALLTTPEAARPQMPAAAPETVIPVRR